MESKCATCDHYNNTCICYRYPTPVPKSPEDRCGEWQNAKYRKEQEELAYKSRLLD